jgi:hypothetical protein
MTRQEYGGQWHRTQDFVKTTQVSPFGATETTRSNFLWTIPTSTLDWRLYEVVEAHRWVRTMWPQQQQRPVDGLSNSGPIFRLAELPKHSHIYDWPLTSQRQRAAR